MTVEEGKIKPLPGSKELQELQNVKKPNVCNLHLHLVDEIPQNTVRNKPCLSTEHTPSAPLYVVQQSSTNLRNICSQSH